MDPSTINYEELERTALPGQFSRYDMEAMGPDVASLKPNEIYLEIGVDRGRSLDFARKVSDKEVVVIGVDINPAPVIPETKFYLGSSRDIARKWHWELNLWRIGVLFIDGDHTYEGAKDDIYSWLPHMKKGGVMWFHDCDETSPGVVRAVFEFVGVCPVDSVTMMKSVHKNTSMCRVKLKDKHYSTPEEEDDL